MRHNRLSGIYRVHEVPDDAVRIQGHLVGGELGHPFLQPPLTHLCDLGCHGSVPSSPLGAAQVLDGVDHLAQDQPCIPEDGIRGLVVLVEVPHIVGGVDDDLARWEGGGHAMLGEARPNGEDDVGAPQEMIHRAAHHSAAAPQGEGMVFREGALALQSRHHGDLEEVCQLDQLGCGLRIEHSLAGMDQRVLRLEQHAGCSLDIPRVSGGAGRLHRGILQRRCAHLLQGHIGRDLDHDRTRTVVLQEIERPPHHFGYLLRQIQRLHRPGHRRIGARRAEERKDLGLIPLMPQRQEQHRCGIGERRGHAGKGVLRPRAILHREHTHGVPIGDPAIPIRNADPDPLLGADLGTNACGGAGLDNGRCRETAEKLDALVFQDGGDSIDDFHGMFSIPTPITMASCRRGLLLRPGLRQGP